MNIIFKLTETQEIILRYYNLPENQLSNSYGLGKWTIRQILVHLADTETVLLYRIKRVIAEPKQVIWSFNQDLWNAHLDYMNFPLELSKSLFLASRENIMYLAKKHYEKSGHKEFVHSETGLRTLKDEFDKVASHCQSHIDQIKKAIIQDSK